MPDNAAPYHGFRYLQVTRQDATAVVSMLDPVDAHFLPLAHPMHTELRDIFPALAADTSVSCVVLTGHGDTFFAGPGLRETRELLTSGLRTGAKQMLEARQICNQLLDFPKPIVSALNGAVIGMGCQLAFLCDFAVAATGVRIQDSHVRLGLPAGDGGTMMWPMLVGVAKARTLLLRAHPLSAEEALELGIVAKVVAPEALIAEALALANKLARLPRFAYSSTKLALHQWFRAGTLFSSDMALGLELAAFRGEEFQQAIDQAIDRSDPPAV
ncbi:MAG TPA: enoyl-CoA hydratase-related protein [Ramlibacter sp.]|nr:enoyl-CoA hydratase-related protein [Ramlibacter sp.]